MCRNGGSEDVEERKDWKNKVFVELENRYRRRNGGKDR